MKSSNKLVYGVGVNDANYKVQHKHYDPKIKKQSYLGFTKDSGVFPVGKSKKWFVQYSDLSRGKKVYISGYNCKTSAILAYRKGKLSSLRANFSGESPRVLKLVEDRILEIYK